MNVLPGHKNLQVGNLVGTLRNVTNSYKFYWFLSILDIISRPENEGTSIEISKILTRMVAFTWFPVNYFRISFGKVDQLANVVSRLVNRTGLNEGCSFTEVNQYIEKNIFTEDTEFRDDKRKIEELAKYVPYRFLTPWFAGEIREAGMQESHAFIVKKADEYFERPNNPPVYKFSKDGKSIIIHEEWFSYLYVNIEIVRGSVLWLLLKYLQKNNPDVPNLSEKLFEPQQRDLKMGMVFWKQAFENEAGVRCIYSDQFVPLKEITIDHFLPWSFTCHDLLWNLVPTSRSVNSSKSDRLPSLDRYLLKMTKLQFEAIKNVLNSENPARENDKLMQDYVALFRFAGMNEMLTCTYENFHQKLGDTIKPQYAIARSMGFQENWVWQA